MHGYFSNIFFHISELNESVSFTYGKRAKAQDPWDTSGQHSWNDLEVRPNVCKIFFFIMSL